MKRVKNPFIVGSYISADYFCDREKEVSMLQKHIDNGRNVALIAPRRLGKTGLIHHFLSSDYMQKEYNVFFLDLYSTNSLREMVQLLANAICGQMQSTVEHWWERFAVAVSSLSMGISIDTYTGQPSFSIGLGQIHSPEHSLEEIFRYLETSDRPCVIAIDEFQQIANYEEKNVEALLRTHIQQCSNTHFIFAGSKRHIMNMMFNSPSRPFYQSSINMSLDPLPLDVYSVFCQKMFEMFGKKLSRDVVEKIYNDFDGYTWYMHMMLNELFSLTESNETCTLDMLPTALNNIIIAQQQTYKEQMSLIPSKQKMVLQAIAKEGHAGGITSSSFIRKYSLPSSSSVQAAVKGLLEKEIIMQEDGKYWVYDYFFMTWLRGNITMS